MPKTTSNRPQVGGGGARHNSLAPASQIVTTHQEFFQATTKFDQLFAVRESIPLNDALYQLIVLIGAAENSAKAAAICVSRGSDANGLWEQQAQLLKFAHALTQSIHRGSVDAQRADRSQEK